MGHNNRDIQISYQSRPRGLVDRISIAAFALLWRIAAKLTPAVISLLVLLLRPLRLARKHR